jgi:hypothetical protein
MKAELLERALKSQLALAGHARDLVRLVRFDVFNPESYSKYRTIRKVQRRTGARMLLETGTLIGTTSRRCAPHFEKVFTIELSPELAKRATANLQAFPHVQVIQGDAQREVKRLLATDTIQDCLVFLDGHFSGGITALGEEPEPAVNILRDIAEHSQIIRAVIVDDFRDFGTQPGWPAKWELVRAAEELFANRGYRLTVHFDQLLLEKLNER